MNLARLIALIATASVPGSASFAGEPLPSLDELLGLEEAGEADLPDADQVELERSLTANEAAEQLEQAVDLMGDAADRLASANPDTGLPTQRLQEDILKKLDMVIDSAQQQQQQQNSQSSSSSQQQQQQQQSQAAANASDSENASMPSADTDATLDPDFLADQADWGALPARTRDALLEGLSDSFSSLYRRLTEAYYRRLAQPAEGDE
ncbi:MAG: hypothetical protein AAGI53_07390 [Planctomycetota bacterium]